MSGTPQEQLAFQTIDDNVWDSKYSERYGELDFGVSSEQGPRESMEDCAHIEPRARCGFLFAAVFDGHSGFAAASYLSDHLYEVFSEAINEGTYGEECSVEGAAAAPSLCMHPAARRSSGHHAHWGSGAHDHYCTLVIRALLCAERDTSGLCCPVELSGLLTASFKRTDRELLEWLQGELLSQDMLARLQRQDPCTMRDAAGWADSAAVSPIYFACQRATHAQPEHASGCGRHCTGCAPEAACAS